jgi:hypothetical protein
MTGVPGAQSSPVAAGLGAAESRGRAAGSAGAEAVLAALDPEQLQVATALHGPVCVLAGAGTGKTRAITHRIAYGVLSGGYEPRQVLAVTFTVKAAAEMRARLRALGVGGVAARTFHAAALRQARWFWPRVVGGDLPPIVDSKLALLREATARVRVAVDLRDVASEIEWAKVSNVAADGYAAAARAGRRVGDLDAETVARMYAAYEAVKAERGVIDLEDVLLAAVGLLAEHPGVAGPPAVPAPGRRRVPGRLAAAAAAARAVAGPLVAAVRRRGSGADDLLVRRRAAGLPRRVPPPLPRRHGRAADP